jgi:uncharacterized protein (DUF488 family)
MSRGGNICYSIGHSNHDIGRFLELLDEHDVTVILDVRSVPYSRRNPQYNRDNLRKTLGAEGYGYEFLGDSLGARGKGPELMFPDGRVDFSKVRETQRFKAGIGRVARLIQGGERPALMCAEREPWDCHRFVLVSCALSGEATEVLHILADGSVLTHESLEQRLLDTYVKPDLFTSPGSYHEALMLAYELRNREI